MSKRWSSQWPDWCVGCGSLHPARCCYHLHHHRHQHLYHQQHHHCHHHIPAIRQPENHYQYPFFCCYHHHCQKHMTVCTTQFKSMSIEQQWILEIFPSWSCDRYHPYHYVIVWSSLWSSLSMIRFWRCLSQQKSASVLPFCSFLTRCLHTNDRNCDDDERQAGYLLRWWSAAS